jgi:hypothetical protein
VYTTLKLIAQKLNAENIVWGVGASVLLSFYQLIDAPRDIDLLVALEDIEKADAILSSLGQKNLWEKSAAYSTRFFYEYTINGVDIDVMSGLKIHVQEYVYEHSFERQSITDHKTIDEIDIPLTSLEDWFVLYQLIPKREAKVAMIEDYLQKNGVKNRFILEKALMAELPEVIRERIIKLL